MTKKSAGKPSTGGDMWGLDLLPLNLALLWSGAGQKVKRAERSGERGSKNQVQRERRGRSSERERKWNWAMSRKFCRSAHMLCSTAETVASNLLRARVLGQN